MNLKIFEGCTVAQGGLWTYQPFLNPRREMIQNITIGSVSILSAVPVDFLYKIITGETTTQINCRELLCDFLGFNQIYFLVVDVSKKSTFLPILQHLSIINLFKFFLGM